MKLQYEHVAATAQMSWRYFHTPGLTFPFFWHLHRECELVLVLRGHGALLVGADVGTFAPGDLVLIGSEVPHSFGSWPDTPARAVVAQFTPDFLGPDLWDRPEFQAVRALIDRAGRGLTFDGAGAAMSDRMLQWEADDPATRTIGLLGVLCELAWWQDQRSLNPADARVDRGGDSAARTRLMRICRYLEDARHSQIRLADVAAVAHLSPAATSRFFRHATGTTLTQYVLRLRIEAACRLLLDTDLPITDITTQAGFTNQSYFNRTFRRVTGVQPREYRAHLRTTP